jgi:hypothetical protein
MLHYCQLSVHAAVQSVQCLSANKPGVSLCGMHTVTAWCTCVHVHENANTIIVAARGIQKNTKAYSGTHTRPQCRCADTKHAPVYVSMAQCHGGNCNGRSASPHVASQLVAQQRPWLEQVRAVGCPGVAAPVIPFNRVHKALVHTLRTPVYRRGLQWHNSAAGNLLISVSNGGLGEKASAILVCASLCQRSRAKCNFL